MHVSLVVADLERAVQFYRQLLQTEPVKQRDDYAKFEVDQPSLNLSLQQGDSSGCCAAGLHFGLEVKQRESVEQHAGRLSRAGLTLEQEPLVDCCYARQSKFWVKDPDGHRWEVFQVLQDI